MAEIHGTGAMLYAKGDDGEWVEIGASPASDFVDSIRDIVIALENVTISLEMMAQFKLDYDKFSRSFQRWLHGWPGHGGAKMRRRKHGGRWAKLDRRQRVPPAWLVRLHHGQ